MTMQPVPTPPQYAPKFHVKSDGTITGRTPARIHAIPQATPRDATPMRQPHSDGTWRDLSDDLTVKLDKARKGELTDTRVLDGLADAWCHELGHDIEPVVTGSENIAHHQLIHADITDVADADIPVNRHSTIASSARMEGHHDSGVTWLNGVAHCHEPSTGWLDDTRPTHKPNLAPWPARYQLPTMRPRKAERQQVTIQRAAYRTRHTYRIVEDRAVIIEQCTCDHSTITPHVHIHAVAPDHDRDHERTITGRHKRPTAATKQRIAAPPRVDVRALTNVEYLASIMRANAPTIIVRAGHNIHVTSHNRDKLRVAGQVHRDKAAARHLIQLTT